MDNNPLAKSRSREQSLRREFDKIDSKRDGVLDREELRHFYNKTMRTSRGELSDDWLDYYTRRLAGDESGQVSFDRFAQVMALSTAESEMKDAPPAPDAPLERATTRSRLKPQRRGFKEFVTLASFRSRRNSEAHDREMDEREGTPMPPEGGPEEHENQPLSPPRQKRQNGGNV
eukprot:Hpha_TRINITY_DN13610_c0_g1::TRINITY_DN13610_c0_g1_i2::g.122856::m.122856